MRWILCADEHGNAYYYNEETEECVWEKPEGYHEEEHHAGEQDEMDELWEQDAQWMWATLDEDEGGASKQPIEEKSLLTGALETTNEAYALAKISGIKLCECLRLFKRKLVLT